MHPSGLLTPHTLGGYLPELAAGYRRVASARRRTPPSSSGSHLTPLASRPARDRTTIRRSGLRRPSWSAPGTCLKGGFPSAAASLSPTGAATPAGSTPRRCFVTILHHLALVSVTGDAVRLRNVFAPELTETMRADAVVLALGRVPEESMAAELAGHGIAVVEAGDCRSPRSLEEAVLEGTLAARNVFA